MWLHNHNLRSTLQVNHIDYSSYRIRISWITREGWNCEILYKANLKSRSWGHGVRRETMKVYQMKAKLNSNAKSAPANNNAIMLEETWFFVGLLCSKQAICQAVTQVSNYLEIFTRLVSTFCLKHKNFRFWLQFTK